MQQDDSQQIIYLTNYNDGKVICKMEQWLLRQIWVLKIQVRFQMLQQKVHTKLINYAIIDEINT